jgi:hypothetical protein
MLKKFFYYLAQKIESKKNKYKLIFSKKLFCYI